LPVSPFREASSPLFPDFLRPTILLAGGNPNLGPQNAETYSIGADIRPPFVDGLNISATYFNVHLSDQIALAPFFNPSALYSPTWAAFYTLSPTQAQVDQLTQGFRLDGAPSIASLYANPFFAPYVIIDARRNNLGKVNIDGIDFAVDFDHPTSFGSVNAGISGTYDLNRKVAAIAGAPFSNDLALGVSRLRLVGSLGATANKFSAKATWNYSQGYDIAPATARGFTQTHVKPYSVFDLYLTYDLQGEGAFRDVTVSLNINNVFDNDPPYYNGGNGYANGSTLGRLFMLGLKKTF
jgi:iron complex outermembrane receptor protein